MLKPAFINPLPSNRLKKYFNTMKKLLTFLLVPLFLASCASHEDEQRRKLKQMASNRAEALSAGLPVERGPLKIMRVLPKDNIVRLMMIYNTDGKNAEPVNQVLDRSVDSFCSNKEIVANLEEGLVYEIKIRNARGQLLIDKKITDQTCNTSAS